MTATGSVRVLLKLSGEALCAPDGFGYDLAAAGPVLDEIVACANEGVQLAVVIGGGNVFRGVQLRRSDVVRDSADRMGMLATLMNALALRDLLRLSPNERGALADAARARAVKLFSAEASAVAAVRLYTALLASTGR